MQLINKMSNKSWIQWLFVTLALCIQSAFSMWEFAVTTKTKILFYDEHWSAVTSAAHQFDQLSAITFDETEEIVYFSDRLHKNGSIFALKLQAIQEDAQIVQKIVQRTHDESITSLAYDPLNRNIYWADSHNKKIYMRPIDAASTDEQKVFIDFSNEDSIPDGIAIDVCRRMLYWTNSNFTNPSVERITLDGNDREVIVKSELHLPHGIVIDQLTNRIYWVVDQQGIHFSVESANLDGSDRRMLVKGLNNNPFNLAVTRDAVFWTDLSQNAVWAYPKFESITINEMTEDEAIITQPRRVLSLTMQPRGIVARTRFLTSMQNDEHCMDVVAKIRNRLLLPKPTPSAIDVQLQNARREYCLNGGDYSEQSGICICKMGYSGVRCETVECQNYCVHGTCTMSSMGFPQCLCQRGFQGKRCQMHKCYKYCLNDGYCKLDNSGDPMCECSDNFGGQRCEMNNTQICALFCRILKHEPEAYVPFGCHDICEELSQQSADGTGTYAIPQYKHLDVCKHTTTWNSTVIIVLVCGVVACFALILLIVIVLRRIYKPARPRIKKTFVVRKQTSAGSETPLTNRPMATEQCEITIENCCNMNICDTPCFDPKIVQQSLSRDHHAKDDKKMLIHNMEDELY